MVLILNEWSKPLDVRTVTPHGGPSKWTLPLSYYSLNA